MAFTNEDVQEIKEIVLETIAKESDPIEDVQQVSELSEGDEVPIVRSNQGVNSYGRAPVNLFGGGGGEPTQYIKDASVSQDGNTLTLTKKNNSTVTFTPNTGGGYNPPQGGIPKTDLASDVQASLNKADAAVPNTRNVNGKPLSDDINLGASDVNAYTKTEVDNLINGAPDSDIIVLDPQGTKVVGDIFPHDASDWEQGSIDGNGQPVASSVRCRTDFIDITTDAVSMAVTRVNTSLPMHVSFNYYNSNKEFIEWHSYISSGTEIPPAGSRYVRFLVKPEVESSFSMTPERAATAANCVLTVATTLDTVPMEDRPNNVFRVPNPSNNSYTDYGWTGSSWVVLLTNYGTDTQSLAKSLDILQDHVDTVTQEGGRFDIFPQNFVQGTVSNGEVVPNNYRITSGLVKVNPDTRYVVDSFDEYNSKLRISFNWYNGKKVYIDWQTYKSVPCIADTTNAEYVRITLRYSDDSAISPDQFIPFSMKAADNSSADYNYFVTDPQMWEYGSIGSDGQPSGSVNYRIRTLNYISIEGGRSYIFNYPDETHSVDVCLYDENFDYLGDTSYVSNGGMAYLDSAVKYCKMLVKPNPDGGTINIQEVVTSGISVKVEGDGTEEVAELTKMNLGLWNIGLLNYGVPVDGRWGIPDNQVAEKLPGVKNVITELNSDLLFICEYSNHVDRSYTIDSYDTIFKHFYPYRYMVGEPWMSVFSKHKLFVKMERNAIVLSDADIYPYDLNGRPIVYGYIIVGGQKVGIMCCHLSPYSSDRRIKEATRICSLMAEYDRCIIAGDLNSDPGVEGFERDMKPFRDAGYEFANGGYWGYKNTYNPNYSPERGGGQMYIDNILTRGIVIDNYIVGNDMSVSDHLPVKSELSILISKE